MNRTMAIVLGLLLACAGLSRAAGLENPFYAMDTISNRGPEPIEQKLDDLKAMGYSGLAWTGTNVDQIKKVIAAADERSLKMHAIYIPFPLAKDQLKAPENLDAVMDALSKHGTLIWVYIQSGDFRKSDVKGDEIAVPALQAIADRAAKRNLKLALYPHAGFWAESFGDCLRIARKVDKPNFGVSFNLCHVLKTGDEARVIELLNESKPHLFMVTINGADANAGPAAGWDRLIQPVGSGSYDLAPLLRQLRQQGYAGPIGFQGYGIKGERKEIMQKTMDGWKKIQAGL